MTSKLRDARGMTIIETTVMLSVLFVLAGMMSPIVSESVLTARAVKAQNDAGLIAVGMINFQRDVGGDAMSYGGSAGIARLARLSDVLKTDGTDPEVDGGENEDEIVALPSTPEDGRLFSRTPKPDRASLKELRRKWLDAPDDRLENHLISNGAGHRLRQPGEYGGWNGPYLSHPPKGDPWGKSYMINTRWLDGGASATTARGTTRRAVFVVSAGGNGIVETPYEQPITDARAYGDDIVIRVQ